MLTDIRDVIFQDDIFKYYDEQNYLGCSEEYLSIEEDKVANSRWIINFFGNEEYQRLKKYKIICCGTVWGTVNEIISFSIKMEEQLRKSTFWGAEQAAANYIIRENLFPIENLLESNVNDGMVLTNGLVQTEIKDDKILNLSGEVPAVVHQYDRHDNQMNLVNEIYRLKKLQMDTIYEDLGSNLYVFDIFIKQKDFPKALERIVRLIEERPNNVEWQGSIFRLVNIFERFFSMSERTITVELLEQSICNALSLSKTIELSKVRQFFIMLVRMKQSQHTIYKPFEMLVCNMIWQVANILEKNGDFKGALTFLEYLKQIDCPLNTQYYLMSARINRLLGNSDKAVEEYKKAVEKS